MTAAVLEGAVCRLRPYLTSDAQALRANADDPQVARWMSARRFPSPYTLDDAREWLAHVLGDGRPYHFAVEVDGAFAGGAGVEPMSDEHRGVALFGYWLGRAYWGRGVGTDAARTLARYGFEQFGLRRIEATVFAPNVASARVLEKAGFRLEGRFRAAYVERDGTVCDGLTYARLASDP